MKNQPNRNYVSNDLVMTPPALAKAIVCHLCPAGLLFDPCAGEMAFYNAMVEHRETLPAVHRELTKVVWAELTRGSDFLQSTIVCDWIITNPPWSQITAFLEKAFQLADHVAYLMTINHAWTSRRLALMDQYEFGISDIIRVSWPSPELGWPRTGFELGVVHYAKNYKGPVSVFILDWHGILMRVGLSTKCVNCKKPYAVHEAIQLRCPTGLKTRAGYISYGPGVFKAKAHE
jgi:hypothetical protein